MGLREWLGWRSSAAPTALAAAPADVAPDLSAFKRASFGSLTAPQLVTLLAIVTEEIGPATRPDRVPLEVLEAMGWDPVIYLGEQATSTSVRDHEIYYVRHPDPAIVAETEAWLWPLLPETLRTLARSVAYGALPYVLDWTVADLRVTVRREGVSLDEVLRDHVHYDRVHEIWPGDAQLLVEDDDLVAVRYFGREYGRDRAFLSIWDRQFGWWLGQGSRRRAYRPWFKSQLVELWQARWLERSVDPPRIGFAPKGNVKIDGREITATELLASALLALKNGGAVVLPSDRTPDGKERVWDVTPLQLPDRSEVWVKSLGRFDAQKLLACLVPPSTVGAEEATFAGARIPAQVFVEFVEAIASYAASELTKIVAVVHAVRHGSKSPAPEILARDLPQAKQKLLLEVFKAIQGVEREVGKGKVVTLGELVSDEVVDMLGLPKRPIDEAARAPRLMAPSPGQARDGTSARDERRQAAREPEGEDATGAPGQGVE